MSTEPTDVTAAVRTAVEIFQSHPDLDDDGIADHLEKQGISEPLTTRLIQFLPIAFCRVFFAPQGVRFPGHYVVMTPHGKHAGEFQMEDEPVYVAARQAAQENWDAGGDTRPFLALAARSASFAAIMKLSKGGASLDKILCSPPILVGGEPKKPWWRKLLPLSGSAE
jgi:hypothetical protein